MAYSPKFDRDARGKFSPDLSFVSLKNGTDAYLLEDEVNESQWIQINARAELTKQITQSGCLQINDTSKPTALGAIRDIGVNFLNSFSINPFYAILNGNLANISSFKSGQTINKVNLPNPPLSGSRRDFVYLEFWFKEVKSGDPVPKFGGISNDSVSYQMIDNRVAFETSRRVQLQWAIRIVSNITSSYPLGFVDANGIGNTAIRPQGPNATIISPYVFSTSVTDNKLFVSGSGTDADKTALKTLDGFVYAIPLFFIKRLNSAGYNATNNTDGAINYVNSSTVSGRPDGKFANVIYADQIVDLRNLATVGQSQYDYLYLRLTDFAAYQASVSQQFATLDTKVTTEVARLDARIDSLKSELNVVITNNINALNTRIDGLNTTVINNFNTLNASIGSLNTKTDNISNNLDGQVLRLDGKIDNVNVTLTNKVNLNDQKINKRVDDLILNYDGKITLINTNITNLANNHATDINALTNSLNSFNTTLSNQIATLNSNVGTLQSQMSTANVNISVLTNQLAQTVYDVAVLQTQMQSIGGVAPPANDVGTYGIEMNRQATLTSGGLIMPDGTVSCIGSPIVVPPAYSPKDNYCVIPTFMSSSADGYIGDFWIDKADNRFLLKNSGAQGIKVDITSFKDTAGKIYSGTSNFNGSTGRTISLSGLGFDGTTNKLDTTKYLIYITPLEDTYGENGEICVSIGTDLKSFTVYNTGIDQDGTDGTINRNNPDGNQFEWVLVSTTGLLKTYFTTINLGGDTGTIVSQPDFGSENGYRVILSTPISTTARPITIGAIGEVAVAKSANSFKVLNTGLNQGVIQCLVFKQ